MNKLSNLFIFALGAAVGSVVTWKLIEKKYAQYANEEIESVKETYSRLSDDDCEEEDDTPIDPEDREIEAKDIENLADIIATNGYGEEEGNKYMNNTPHVIPPEEYGENDYECETLYYYPDGVLTDTYDNVIEDVEGTVGEEAFNHFGEWEDDSVFVRNDDRQIDYEILLQADNFHDESDE